MTDKHLTESSWKSFAKGGDYKDSALLKALAALSKAERDGPQAVLDALDDVEKQVKTLRSAHKGDKDLTGYLDKVDKAAEAQRKDSQKELKEAETADDEEEDSPALLTSKLVPLIKQVRKGDVVMKAMIVTTGKDTAVMLSKRAIAPTRSKLLKEYLGASGGAKTILGDCLLEENAITFVVQSQAAGLAKKLKAALMAQTELRLKIRVRGEDPDDIDEEGEAAEDGQVADGDTDAKKAPDSTAENPPPTDVDKQRFEQRLGKLEPLVAAMLKAQRGDTNKIRAIAEFAREKGPLNPATGLKALDSLEALLRAAAAQQPTAKPESPGTEVDPGAAFNARLSALLPRVKDFIAAAGPQAAELKLKVSEAGVLARKREFERAHELLDEAEEVLSVRADRDQPSTSDETKSDESAGGEPAPKNGRLTRERQFLVQRWSQIPGELRAQLQLQVQALRQDPDMAEADEDANELIGAIESALNDLLQEVQDEIDEAINAGDSGVLAGLRKRVMDNALMKHLETAPGIDGALLLRSMRSALDEVEKAMTA